MKGVSKMKKQTFLFSACNALLWLLSYNNVYADVSNFKTTDNFFLTNTQHTQFLSDASGLSPDEFIKVAQVCWIMDTGECFGVNFISADRDLNNPSNPEDYVPKGPADCIEEGYTVTNCPNGYKGNKECLYAKGYYAECVEDCPSNYKQCEEPYHGVGQECGDGYYASCQCDYCDGYSYKKEDIPDGYVADGEPCVSCNGEMYKIKVNPCEGYQDCGSMGGKVGATSCLSGTNMMYSECKPCPSLGEYDTCPPCSVCTYEECSNKYYVTGCAAGCQDYCDYCAFEQ